MKMAELNKAIENAKYIILPCDAMVYLEDLYKGDLTDAFDKFEKDHSARGTLEFGQNKIKFEYSYHYEGTNEDHEKIMDVEFLEVNGIKLYPRNWKAVYEIDGSVIGYYDGEYIIMEEPEIGNIE